GETLPAKGRPEYAAFWIGRARSLTYVPDMGYIQEEGQTDEDAASLGFDKFRSDMKTWWHNLNPEWRKKDDSHFELAREAGDFSQLYYPGINGLVTLVKSLKWWWEAIETVQELPGDRQ
ncbi:hypothetical protein BD626DRAFT_357867, partial [Schizophyllum amplum]